MEGAGKLMSACQMQWSGLSARKATYCNWWLVSSYIACCAINSSQLVTPFDDQWEAEEVSMFQWWNLDLASARYVMLGWRYIKVPALTLTAEHIFFEGYVDKADIVPTQSVRQVTSQEIPYQFENERCSQGLILIV